MRKPCRKCQKPTGEIGALCTICKTSAQRARPSRHARGYGRAYERARAELAATFTPSESQCVICGSVIHNLRDWTAEHLTPLRAGGSSELANLGHAHAACNYGWSKDRRDN